MASIASSDEDEFVVHKKKLNHSGTHLLSDSDDDSPTQPVSASTCDESPSSENASKRKSSEFNNGANALHVSDVLDTKENHVPKRRIIRAQSNSDDDNSTTKFFGKSAVHNSQSVQFHRVVDSDSESDGEIKVKSSRVKKRDKMVENMKRRFVNKEKKNLNTDVNNDTVKPLISFCDKDTSTDSDENQPSLTINSASNVKGALETKYSKSKSGSKQKQVKHKTTKLLEELPTPKRMSAKEAMENMTKIKSESNRMLRESRVLLPYHRPKQVSLKDILSRKKPGPDLPLRMNQEQLEQYATQLEESQKKMKLLYKSDDEDEGNVLNMVEQVMEEKDLKEIEEKSINENLDGKIDHNYIENARKENEHLSINNEASTENKLDEKMSSDAFNAISLDANKINKLNNDNLVNMPTVKGDDNVEESVKSTDSIYSEQHTNIDSQFINLHYNSETSFNVPAIKRDDEIKKSIKLTDTVSSKHHSNLDSQFINLHYNSETVEVSIERVNRNSTELNTVVNEAMIDFNINDEHIVDKISNQNTEPSNTTECNAEIEIEKTTSASSLTESRSEIYENEKNKICVETEIRLSTNDYTSAGEKECEKEGVPDLAEDYSFDDDFPDDDVDISHIDAIMDKIESDKDHYKLEDSPMLIKDVNNIKPRLSGAPGMVIDLDAPSVSNKMSGVEMLKHRYMFFSNIKTPEEKEREKEKQMKPGTKHRMLKLELEKKIAEQSIAEWNKRVEEEKQKQQEIMAINGELSECEDELDKIEKECDQKEKDATNYVLAEFEQDEDEGEGDEVEDEEECKDLKERPKKWKENTFIEDEAEVEDDEDAGDDDTDISGHEDADGDIESDSSEDQSSTEEDVDIVQKPKKGRIIKAFEDSDDEEPDKSNKVESELKEVVEKENEVQITALQKCRSDLFESQTTDPDEEISLAQPNQSNPEDMNISFAEDSEQKKLDAPKTHIDNSANLNLFETQHNTQVDMEAIVGMCSGNFPSDSPTDLPQVPSSISRLVEGGGVPSSQVITEDILQLCSGKFDEHLVATQTINNENFAETLYKETDATTELPALNKNNATKGLFNELEDDDLNLPKTNKYFGSNINGNSENLPKDAREENSKGLQKGKLVIESSDEETEGKIEAKKKKLKKKKPDKRALVISDDEDEDSESALSELEDEEMAEEGERLVEYDSEENEVEVVPAREVRRRAHDFMEREAELSSEGEWAGSGDEDERGLDRLEREAGDDDVFHQGRLQRELGQIHAQDLMEQDRREVRMLQEILLEDGDLEGGGRQRRFRWRDTDGADEGGTVPDEFRDTPEEERESEEQWRRQRHERQLFLRQLASEEKSEDILGFGTTASSLIASSVRIQTASVAARDGEETCGPGERNQAGKDFPSPVKNTFTLMQRQYRALVSGGGGATALRRLAAALAPAEPPAAAAAARQPPGQRSFVFAPLAHPAPLDDDAPDGTDDGPARKTKRKADVPVGTPKLIKKLRLQEQPRKSILQQLDT